MNDSEITIDPATWETLNGTQRDFLRQAHAAGLGYAIESGEPTAWGSDIDGVFTMAVRIEFDAERGKLVTLAR